ncbi:hypothetical protein BOX15_Mlig032114g1 [Macrostomum lignano]|uniref:dihydropyrimidinase n=2 Tax=Macrostomum lignano TaxID=282301 RepID=A0A267FG46_9PLAT|nr:hypothetical protein BOX15_Mlig032114g1 [Macrostomum lignano]
MNDAKVQIGVNKLGHHVQSSQNRLLIKGGKVVNDDGIQEADVYVEGGVIKQVGTGLLTPGGVRVIDAAGMLIMPGGIDPHTHMQMPFMGTHSADDFYTGTRAALAGGTTMIIDFVACPRGDSLMDWYNKYRAWADEKVCCDYGLHVIVPQWGDKTANEMATLVKEKGINSFKCFMAYRNVFLLEDDEMLNVFQACRKLGAVAQVHAENGKIIERKAEQLVADGIRGPEGHSYSRPEAMEIEATTRALAIADEANCPLYVVHVMSAEAGEAISKARRRGQVCYGEPIAAGLACDNSSYQHTCWRHAAGHVLSPPLRDPSTKERLWRMLATGELTCTGTDHCVFKADQKALGKDDFRRIPNGVNGVEDRMSVLWEKGVETGILDPCQFVAATSTNAAKVFNLYPQKGRIAVGSDADIVVWNAKETRTISAKTHHQNVDFNIFEGMVCHGIAEFVISGGRLVVDERQLKVTQGAGRFVPMPAFPPYVYNRLEKREAAKSAGTVAVARDAYDGPVIDLKAEQERQKAVAKEQPGAAGGGGGPEAAAENVFHRPPTRGGGRHMQESSFSLSGAQFDDTKPARSGIRTHQPPGGASSGSLW